MLPRQEAHGSHCADCSSALEPWEGQAGARAYMFHARDVAHGLARVATGSSYRAAAAATRIEAGRNVSGVTGGTRRRRRQRVLDGQLVANWVDVFGPVVTFDHGHSLWPERIAVDCVGFRVGGPVPRTLYIMVAVGYDAPAYQPQVWLMRPYAEKTQDAWESFFEELRGTPARIVADMDGAIQGAVSACFPRPGSAPPDYHWSDLHVQRAIENALGPLHAQPDHEIWKLLDRALLGPAAWDRFVRAVEQEDATATSLPAMTRWLGNRAALIRAQSIRRGDGPYSTGAVEAVNLKLKNELIGERANRLGNRRRMIKLLDLLTVGLNGRASEREFAKAVRIHLETHQGRPLLSQRQHDDLRGAPSLYV